MTDEIKQAETDQLWTRIWKLYWEIDDSDWPEQVQRLRDLARTAALLADVIEGAQ